MKNPSCFFKLFSYFSHHLFCRLVHFTKKPAVFLGFSFIFAPLSSGSFYKKASCFFGFFFYFCSSVVRFILQKSQLFFWVFLLFLPACHTVHFTKKPAVFPKSYSQSKWHHIGFLGLIELSQPVNLKEFCPRKSWKAVRVQTGFLQMAVRALGPVFQDLYGVKGSFFMIPIGAVYSPEEVSVLCQKFRFQREMKAPI